MRNNYDLLLNTIESAFQLNNIEKPKDFSLLKNEGKTVRLGSLLDKARAEHRLKTSVIKKNGYILDTYNDVFKKPDGTKINLTDKENALLKCLFENKIHAVDKDHLLKSVWNYADTVETHTLETHIYRLRQKIENNPATPTFLITKDNGYALSFSEKT